MNSSAASAVIVRSGSIDDDARAGGPGGLDRRPQVTVREPRVRRPQDDQLAVAQLERVERLAGAVRHRDARRRPSGRTAHGRPGLRPCGGRTAVERHHRQQALVAGAAVRVARPRRRRSSMTRCRLSAIVDSASSHVVGSNSPDPFGPGAAQRREDAVRAVHAVEEPVDLRAQLALAVRVLLVATQLDGDAVGDGDLPAARVRAVVVARAVHDRVSR